MGIEPTMSAPLRGTLSSLNQKSEQASYSLNIYPSYKFTLRDTDINCYVKRYVVGSSQWWCEFLKRFFKLVALPLKYWNWNVVKSMLIRILVQFSLCLLCLFLKPRFQLKSIILVLVCYEITRLYLHLNDISCHIIILLAQIFSFSLTNRNKIPIKYVLSLQQIVQRPRPPL